MGMRTDLRAFAQPGVLGLAAALTVAAIVGKQALLARRDRRGVDRLSIGIGMIPRGEVGPDLRQHRPDARRSPASPSSIRAIFSAVVVMVIVTTMVTPPALKWSFERFDKRKRNAAPQSS